jgi:hypothetical protein
MIPLLMKQARLLNSQVWGGAAGQNGQLGGAQSLSNRH